MGVLKIFDVLLKAFKQGSFNLVIKGKPGTGKTMFTLSLLKKLKSGIYISTRVSLAELRKQVPWVNKLLEEDRIVEASFSRVVLGGQDHFLKAAHLTEFLEKLYNLIDSRASADGPVTLVLDSVEAIKEHYNIPKESLTLEKALIDIGVNGKFNIIFVSEVEKETSLDYLADGVITFKMKIEDGMILRTATITKLRGINIERPIQYFTITEDGVVFLSPLKKIAFSYNGVPLEKTPEGQEIYPTGIKGLSDALDGGYSKGSMVLLLIDDEVPLYASAYPNDMTAIQIMKLGIPWYYLSGYDYSGTRMHELLKKELPEIDVDLLFRPLSIKRVNKEKGPHPHKVVFVLEDKKNGITTTNPSLTNLIVSDLKVIRSESFYITVGLNILDAYFDKNEVKMTINELSALVRETGSLATYFLYTPSDLSTSILQETRYKLHIKIKDGIPLLYIAKPYRKGFYWLDINPDRKQEQIRLVKIS